MEVFGIVFAMAFMRADSSCTLLSRKWSTAELGEGLAHLLTDGQLDLPEDMSQLKDLRVLGTPVK